MIYSIVRKVLPGAYCSHRKGEYEIEHAGTQTRAQELVDRYNLYCATVGISYYWRAFDRDDDPARPPTEKGCNP